MTRRTRLVGGVTLAVVAVATLLVWWFVFRDTSPPSVLSAEQEDVRDEALADVDAEPEASAEPAADAEPEASAQPAADAPTGETPESGDTPAPAPEAPATLDGTWIVDTTIGSFDDFSSSFAGFRIDEELVSIGAKTAVGRTPGVEGALQLDGTTVTAVDVVVDMTQLTTDDSRRDRAIRQQAIETADFPTATFALTEPIALGEIPEGAPIQVDAIGELTIHGVTNDVTIPLQAELVNGVIVVAGELGPFPLELYDIDPPSAAAVLSVEDKAIMELQLFFTR